MALALVQGLALVCVAALSVECGVWFIVEEKFHVLLIVLFFRLRDACCNPVKS